MMRDAELVHSEILAKSPKRFVHEVLRMPDGEQIDWYYIDSPRSAMIVPLTTEGSVVLIEQYRYNLRRKTLELPAGVVDSGEAPEVTALRELREETGYGEPSSGSVTVTGLGSHYSLPSETNRYTNFFLATGVEKLEAARHDNQIERYFEMRVVEMPFSDALDAIGDRIDGVETVCGLMLAERMIRRLRNGG
jgi:ADP-ribose pyrophosphatase